MSRLIRELIGADKATFDTLIRRLEHVTMQQSVDVRLTAELITKSREKIRSLGLDPKDSTYSEVYYTLQAKVAKDGAVLREKLGITDATKAPHAVEKLAKALEPLLRHDQLVCVQPQAIRSILHDIPPKKTLKTLKLRSIDSVLKRENPLVLYALARKIEQQTWHKQVDARLKRLKTNEVTEMAPQVLVIPEAWFDRLHEYTFEKVVHAVPEVGAVLVLPSVPLQLKGAVILSAMIILQAAQHMVVESLPFRKRGMMHGRHTIVHEVAARSLPEVAAIHGLQPTWHLVYQLLAEQSKHALPESEFVYADLEWRSAEMRLSTLLPEADFWVDSHYLGILTNSIPVSFHIVDVAASTVLKRSFGEQIVSHLRGSLWNELQLRYLKEEVFERAVLAQLTKEEEMI